ncbi:phage terminase small subunit P27 family [Candidatus Parcubacteria bacterium]|nr:MAG: phage terminase small subunit P27 family [Candidatus Parcubacteria bacterium]
MPGRKPIPTNMKLLKGNPGKRALNENEPKPEIEIPDPPRFLTGYALEEWHEITPILYRLGLVSKPDRAALAAYCQAFQRWAEAEEQLTGLDGRQNLLTQDTSGNIRKSPLVNIAHEAMDQMRRFLVEFGMTPSSRAKAVARKPNENKSPWDKFKTADTRKKKK